MTVDRLAFAAAAIGASAAADAANHEIAPPAAYVARAAAAAVLTAIPNTGRVTTHAIMAAESSAAAAFSTIPTIAGQSVDAHFGPGKSARMDIFNSVRADATMLLDGAKPQQLVLQPLWSGGRLPPWVGSEWAALRGSLARKDAHWKVWIEWYQDRLDGKPSSLQPSDISRVVLGEEFWEGGPEKVNRELLRLIEEQERKKEHPLVPAVGPAAIEPVWDDGHLVLPKNAAASDLDGETLGAALRSLRTSLTDLADDAANDANIDQRAVRMLRRQAERIPERVPPQDVLFDIGHALAKLRDYQGTVHEQWPNVLAADYNSLLLQYDRTVRQFPRWREFVRNAEKGKVTPEEATAAIGIAEEFSAILDIKDVERIVDPAIPAAINRLLQQLPSPEDIANANELIDGGVEEITLDLLESVDNILKRLAERAVEGRRLAGDSGLVLAMWLKDLWDDRTFAKSRENFVKAFRKQLPAEATKWGGKAAKAVFPVLVGLVLFALSSAVFGVLATAGGAGAVALASRFRWLKDLLAWFKKTDGS